MAFSIEKLASRDALATELSAYVAAHLLRAVKTKGHALLAVSGGTTPALFFETLSKTDLPWDKIGITLVDERCVDETSDRSNTRLVKQILLQNHAAKAVFIPLYISDGSSPEDAAKAADDRFAKDDAAVIILGMGNDGHTASLFPDGDYLTAAMDMDSRANVLPMTATGAGEPRLTFTLPFIARAAHIALHIEGDDKLVTFEKAINGKDQADMPIRALLNHPNVIVSTFWAPKN